MKKLTCTTIFIAGCLCLTAHAAKITVPVSVTANGKATATANVPIMGVSVTNWATLYGMFVTVPAISNVTADIVISDTSGGVSCSLDTITLGNSNTNGANRVYFIEPRKGVWSAGNPAVDRFAVTGTNTFISVTQTGATTNTWAIKLLIEQ